MRQGPAVRCRPVVPTRPRFPKTAPVTSGAFAARIGAALILVAVALAPFWIDAAPAAAGGPVPPTQAEAAAISARITALGNSLSAMDERFNQEKLVLARLEGELSRNTAALHADSLRVDRLQSLVRSEAVLDFMEQGQGTSGGTSAEALAGGDTTASNLRSGFLGAVSSSQSQTVRSLEEARRALSAQNAKVDSARLAALSALNRLESDRASTQRAAAAEKSLLAGVTGQLSVLVSRQQAASARAATQAFLSRIAPQAPPPGIPAPPSPGTPAAPSSAAGTVLGLARAQLGRPYVWAAAGPSSFDCSGLVMFVYAHVGVDLSHSAQAQYDASTPVSAAQAQPGDLAFFGSGPSDITHVGIYVGGGQMIDAPYTGAAVRYDSVAWGGLVGFGRVL